jgi:hypothetical protein
MTRETNSELSDDNAHLGYLWKISFRPAVIILQFLSELFEHDWVNSGVGMSCVNAVSE